jgi:hypothetical protein
MRPRHFWVQTAPPSDGQPDAIDESHYIVEDGTVILSDAIGNPLFGERYQRKLRPEDDEMAVARQLLCRKASRLEKFQAARLDWRIVMTTPRSGAGELEHCVMTTPDARNTASVSEQFNHPTP